MKKFEIKKIIKYIIIFALIFVATYGFLNKESDISEARKECAYVASLQRAPSMMDRDYRLCLASKGMKPEPLF